MGFLIGLAMGAALAFLLDPKLGRRRRAMGRDQLAATMRRGGRQIARVGRKATSDVAGMSEHVAHLNVVGAEPANDPTLKAKVESELFQDPDVPKGRINVSSENRVIVLRGELDRPEEINAIESKVRRIPGVVDVENLLHLKGTPARHSA